LLVQNSNVVYFALFHLKMHM